MDWVSRVAQDVMTGLAVGLGRLWGWVRDGARWLGVDRVFDACGAPVRRLAGPVVRRAQLRELARDEELLRSFDGYPSLERAARAMRVSVAARRRALGVRR